MKIAITTSGSNLNAPLDSRFGRSPKFLVYDQDNGSFEIIDNQQNLNATQGAGIQSAETVVRSGAKVLVSGHCGPKAFRVLAAAGVKVYTSDAPTVAAALETFKAGKLKEAGSADVEGHWWQKRGEKRGDIMPGFDGTGPRGKGPMTGKAQGYCLLKIPDDAGEAKSGFAGLAGKPIAMSYDHHLTDSLSLQSRLREMQVALAEMKFRLAELEVGGHK